MTEPNFLDEPVTVTAVIDHTGNVRPTSMRWQENDYQLIGIGRQWESEEGRHVLVEAADGSRFEMQLSRQDLVWRLRRSWTEELTA